MLSSFFLRAPVDGVCGVKPVIVTGPDGKIPSEVDFIVYPKHEFESKIISKLSGHIEPLSFPLFFPLGKAGYSIDLRNCNGKRISSSVH